MIGRAIITALLSFGLYQLPIPTLTGLLVLTLAYLCYVYWVFKKWNQEFAGYRTHRGHKHSPSNRTLPPIKSLDENKKSILNNSKLHKQFDTYELLSDVQDMEVTRKENQIIRERAKRSIVCCPRSLLQTWMMICVNHWIWLKKQRSWIWTICE